MRIRSLVCILLCIVLIAGLVPTGLAADGGSDPGTDFFPEEPAEPPDTEGEDGSEPESPEEPQPDTAFTAFSEQLTAGDLTLDADMNLQADSTIEITDSELDLMGHTLAIDANSTDLDLFTVRGSFVVSDSAGGGKLLYKNGRSVVSVTRKGRLFIQGGTITAEKTSGYLIKSSGIVQLIAGTLDGNQQAGGIQGITGQVNVWGGEICNCKIKGTGAAVQTSAGCVFNMADGRLHHNTAQDSGATA